MTRCPLLVKYPVIAGYPATACKTGVPLTMLTLYAWCAENHEACPDYRRHMVEQKVKEAAK